MSLLGLIRTEVVLKSKLLGRFRTRITFNKNRSCIEIEYANIVNAAGVVFNKNRSCIEIV